MGALPPSKPPSSFDKYGRDPNAIWEDPHGRTT